MSFLDLARTAVVVIKPDGARSKAYMSVFQNHEAIVPIDHMDVSEGDVLGRLMPGNKLDLFDVLEVHFQEGIGNIPGSYKLSLRKQASLKPPPGSSSVSVINSQGVVIGDHNQQSIVVSLQSLLEAIDRSGATPEVKAEARSRVKALLAHPLVNTLLGAAATALGTKLATGS
jgi:hypothetical protein